MASENNFQLATINSQSKYFVQYGRTRIAYTLNFSRRKSLEIAVHPDRSVVVKAPEDCTLEEVQRRVKKRRGWIRKQIRYFEQFEPRKPPRLYVRGESHLYLGRNYRLKIAPAETAGIVLKGGYFRIHTPNMEPEAVKALLQQWYLDRAKIWFEKIFATSWQHFAGKGLQKPTLKIRTMKTRWGSLSAKGRLSLNLQLIQAPGECIEYVLIHELCHLLHRKHRAAFYELQATILPDWAQRKQKLEQLLS